MGLFSKVNPFPQLGSNLLIDAPPGVSRENQTTMKGVVFGRKDFLLDGILAAAPMTPEEEARMMLARQLVPLVTKRGQTVGAVQLCLPNLIVLELPLL